MTNLPQKSLAAALCCIAAVALSACKPVPLASTSVEDLMGDPVSLDGLLMKCNGAGPSTKSTDACRNARIAVERIAKQREKVELAQREAAFERNRERLRVQQEALQRQQEEAKKVDPYKLPLIPPRDAPAPSPPTTANN
jgi:hypothetical protein